MLLGAFRWYLTDSRVSVPVGDSPTGSPSGPVPTEGHQSQSKCSSPRGGCLESYGETVTAEGSLYLGRLKLTFHRGSLPTAIHQPHPKSSSHSGGCLERYGDTVTVAGPLSLGRLTFRLHSGSLPPAGQNNPTQRVTASFPLGAERIGKSSIPLFPRPFLHAMNSSGPPQRIVCRLMEIRSVNQADHRS
jgi:hypothetical protein